MPDGTFHHDVQQTWALAAEIGCARYIAKTWNPFFMTTQECLSIFRFDSMYSLCSWKTVSVYRQFSRTTTPWISTWLALLVFPRHLPGLRAPSVASPVLLCRRHCLLAAVRTVRGEPPSRYPKVRLSAGLSDVTPSCSPRPMCNQNQGRAWVKWYVTCRLALQDVMSKLSRASFTGRAVLDQFNPSWSLILLW